MHPCLRSAAAVGALALAATLPAFASEMCPLVTPPVALLAVHTDSACNAWIETTYYNNASHTTVVGHCTITCQQWDLGNVLPTFDEGGKCTGVPSNFGVDMLHLCPCPP